MELNLVATLAFGDDSDGLCPREQFEDALTNGCRDWEAQAQIWRMILEDTPPQDLGRFMQRVAGVNLVNPPEGTSWQRWAEWIGLRLDEVAEDRSTLVPFKRHMREWRWRSGVLLPDAQGRVREALSRIAPPVGDGVREYLVVDVDEAVGTFATTDRTTRAVEELPSRRLGMVIDRSEGFRVVGMTAADPSVDPRAADWQRRWPVLFTALGGWFNEASFERYDPWSQQIRMLEGESDERLAVLAAEGSELLELDDEEVRAVVAATGCVVEPAHLRWWLEWMFWRIGYFDWK